MTGPRRDGFAFKGWATAPDGEVVYSASDVHTAPVGTVLYAIYAEGDEVEETTAEETTPADPSTEETSATTAA